MKNPAEGSSLSTPGLLLGKIASASENASKKKSESSSFQSSLQQSQTDYTRESSKFDGGTYTLRPKSGDRKSLIDDGRWLSLDRRGKTSKQSSSLLASANVSRESTLKRNDTSKQDSRKSASRSPSRGKS